VGSRPFPHSLGDIVAASIEARSCHGPGDVYGQSVRLTTDEYAFLEQAYAIDCETGRRKVDIAVYSRRKGLRKSELGAWLVVEETTGPVRAYWDGGQPIARPPMDPSVICAATTADQGELVYGAFRAIVAASEELEPLYDVGMEETQLIGQPGKVELKQTRNPAALDGGRPTFEVGDEAHRWKGLQLMEAYRIMVRNLRKRRESQPWMFLPTTAYGPGEGSVFERLHTAARAEPPAERLLVDHLEASLSWDLDDPEQLRKAIVEAGGGADWYDLEAMAAGYHDPTEDEQDYRRYTLNQPVGAADQWVTPDEWSALARPDLPLQPGDAIALGFDGSDYDDATALVGVRLSDGHAQVLGLWQRPTGAAGLTWSVPRALVNRVLAATHARYRVVRGLADPPGWRDDIARWSNSYGGVWREFRTAVPTYMGPAIERASTAIRAAEMSHDGSAALAAHIVGCRLVEDRGHLRLAKRNERIDKIDAAVAWVLAHEARGRALAGGFDPHEQTKPDYAFAAW
jgi:hypothetical protein